MNPATMSTGNARRSQSVTSGVEFAASLFSLGGRASSSATIATSIGGSVTGMMFSLCESVFGGGKDYAGFSSTDPGRVIAQNAP
jgi:hypothetical protein